MRIITSLILVLMSFSFSMADETSLQNAFSLYNRGKMEAAIEIIQDHVKEFPDPKALYFLGYAYYKIKKMNLAMKYFNEAYLIDPDFSPQVFKEVKIKGAPTDEILKNIESKTRNIRSYTADMTITVEMMGQEMITEGEIIFKKPEKMRMEMSSNMFPQSKMMVISDGQTMWTYMPAMNMVQKMDLARMKKELSEFYRIEDILEQQTKQSGDMLNPLKGFNRDSIKFVGIEQTAQGKTYTLEVDFPEKMLDTRAQQWGFTPSKAKFWILEDNGVAVKMDIYTQTGNKMMSQEYKNIKLNPKISDSMFVFSPPEGAQVMDMTDATINMMKNMFKSYEPASDK